MVLSGLLQICFLTPCCYSFSRWTHALADPWKEGVCPLNASEILKFLPKVTEHMDVAPPLLSLFHFRLPAILINV